MPEPMRFIKPEDYNTKIRSKQLDQIIQGNDSIKLDAENVAIATVRDALYPYYDTQQIFINDAGISEEDLRHQQVVRWVMNLIMYYLYERIPDKLVPDRIIKNYDDTMSLLMDISDGKKSVDLPRLTDSEGSTITKFRWGSQEQRYFEQ